MITLQTRSHVHLWKSNSKSMNINLSVQDMDSLAVVGQMSSSPIILHFDLRFARLGTLMVWPLNTASSGYILTLKTDTTCFEGRAVNVQIEHTQVLLEG